MQNSLNFDKADNIYLSSGQSCREVAQRSYRIEKQVLWNSVGISLLSYSKYYKTVQNVLVYIMFNEIFSWGDHQNPWALLQG